MIGVSPKSASWAASLNKGLPKSSIVKTSKKLVPNIKILNRNIIKGTTNTVDMIKGSIIIDIGKSSNLDNGKSSNPILELSKELFELQEYRKSWSSWLFSIIVAANLMWFWLNFWYNGLKSFMLWSKPRSWSVRKIQHFFRKSNFFYYVEKLLKGWFHGKYLNVIAFYYSTFPNCAVTVWKLRKFSHAFLVNISWK